MKVTSGHSNWRADCTSSHTPETSLYQTTELKKPFSPNHILLSLYTLIIPPQKDYAFDWRIFQLEILPFTFFQVVILGISGYTI